MGSITTCLQRKTITRRYFLNQHRNQEYHYILATTKITRMLTSQTQLIITSTCYSKSILLKIFLKVYDMFYRDRVTPLRKHNFANGHVEQ